jgi:hypothetical protein
MNSIIVSWPPCNCHGVPHNKLLIVTDTGTTITEACQFALYLMSQISGKLGTYPFDLHVAVPPQVWLDAVSALDD